MPPHLELVITQIGLTDEPVENLRPRYATSAYLAKVSAILANRRPGDSYVLPAVRGPAPLPSQS